MLPLIDFWIELFIGYDRSRALEPESVITGGDFDPYAIKTDLGRIVGSTNALIPWMWLVCVFV